MNILSQEQVLDSEMKLLNTAGPSLTNFYSYDPDQSLFHPPTPQTKQHLQQQHKLTNLKTPSPTPNSMFHTLTYILLHCLHQQYTNKSNTGKNQLQQTLKSALYSPTVNLKAIIAYEYGQLTNNVMKKILVQFLQIMRYNTGEIQLVLAKFRIVLDIFTLFFRTILLACQVRNAELYKEEVNSLEVFTKLLDFFEISYQVRYNLVVFEGRTICVLLDDKTNKYYIGERVYDLSTKTSDLNLELIEEGEDENYILKKDNYVFNTPTPCFGEVSWEDTLKMHKNGVGEHQRKQSLQKVVEENYAYESAKKVPPALEVIHYDSEQHNDRTKFKNILDSIPNSPVNHQENLKHIAARVSAIPRGQPTFNPERMKYSEIHANLHDDQFEKKSSKSENIGKRKTEGAESAIEDGKLSQYGMEKGRTYRVESHAIEQPVERRYKTNTMEQYRPVRKTEYRAPPNPQTKPNPLNKTYSKIPQFLSQKQIGRCSNSNSPLNHPPTTRHRADQKKMARPKVVFTYNQKGNMSYSGPTPIDTSRIVYLPETQRGPVYNYEPTFIQRAPFMYPQNIQHRQFYAPP